MSTTFGAWLRFDFQRAIDSGRIPEGTVIKISKKPSWLPSWLARAFVNPNNNTAVIEWPAPGVALSGNVQLVAFERGSVAEATASAISRGF